MPLPERAWNALVTVALGIAAYATTMVLRHEHDLAELTVQVQHTQDASAKQADKLERILTLLTEIQVQIARLETKVK